jgi:PAS domain S-box-containing protein
MMHDGDLSGGILDAVLDAAVDAIIVCDAAGHIVRANIAAARLFGYEIDSMPGRSVEDLMPESERSRHAAAMERYIRTGEPRVIGIGRDVEGLRADGALFPLHLSVGHARIDDRDYFVAILHDLSRRTAVERSLQQAQRLEALGALTGGVAHDFNNILTVISGNLELLDGSLSDKSARTLVHDAMAAATLGADLTSKLLALGRRSVLSPRLLDPAEVTASTLSLLRRTAAPGVDLRLVAEPGVWSIRVDQTQLQTSIINLALNAQDAMPNGGTITVAIGNVSVDDRFLADEVHVARGNYVRISVTDTGVGMDETARRRAFEPFFTTKPSGRGTGLGLSMVYGFAAQSGGHATLYSEPGLGTTVSLYFPAVANAAGAELLPPGIGMDSEAGRTPDRRVLVVEDNDAVRRLSVARLEALGYRTMAATNAEEALELLGTDPDVDVVFADIVMPGSLNGHDLARRVASEHPDVSVLLTSGFAGGIAATAAEEFPLLQKPYRESDLATRLRILLSRRGG